MTQHLEELGARIQEVWDPLIAATLQSPFYMQYGLLVVFLYSATPNALFIPNEVFWVTLFFETVDKANFLLVIVFITAIGGFLGDSLIYFITRKGLRYFTKGYKGKEELKTTHLFHKHRHIIFLIAPTIPVFSEGVLIFAAVKKLPFLKFAPYLLGGNFIKNIIEVSVFVLIGMGVGFIEF